MDASKPNVAAQCFNADGTPAPEFKEYLRASPQEPVAAGETPPVTKRTAAEIAVLVGKYPCLGVDVFVHEHDYNQAENSRKAAKEDLVDLLRECDEHRLNSETWRARADELQAKLDRMPADWDEDSSLDTWFPITREALDGMHAHLAEPEGWRPIATAPKDCLIDIWIPHIEGGGVRWTGCYYDHICDEWRTISSSGHLVTVKARHVSHWHAIPAAPQGGK